jgi:hypothetical protein
MSIGGNVGHIMVRKSLGFSIEKDVGVRVIKVVLLVIYAARGVALAVPSLFMLVISVGVVVSSSNGQSDVADNSNQSILLGNRWIFLVLLDDFIFMELNRI